MYKPIGILGGMGPYATVSFETLLLRAANAPSDQESPVLLVVNDGTIPDRTRALLEFGSSPVPAMRRRLLQLRDAGAEVLCVPCNTAHAFYEKFKDVLEGVTFVHIVDAVIAVLKDRHSSATCIGLMGTTGTKKAGVYDSRMQAAGFSLIYPDDYHQDLLMQAIYGEQGIKAGFFDEPRTLLLKVVEFLGANQAEVIILGCTEISIALKSASLPLIDSTESLAQGVVRAARLSHERA